jgi:hypothetical protein
LFEQPSLIKPACFDWAPAEFAHQLCQPSTGTCTPVALWHLQYVKHGLRADSLYAVVADFATQSFQPQTPRIRVPREHLGAA